MQPAKKIKPIAIAAVILVVLGLFLLLKRSGGIVSPLPEEGGVRIIFASPHPSTAAEPSPSASASASTKASAKPKASASASPKASDKASSSPKATP